MRKRLLYIILVLVAGVMGYSSRKYGSQLPEFLALYTGDTVWAFAAYFFLRLFMMKTQAAIHSLITYVFSVLIEISQLYHAVWIDKIRGTLLGGLALGFGFHFQDLICYLLGIVLALLIDTKILIKFIQ